MKKMKNIAGSWKSEDGRPKIEAESRGQSGPAVSNRGFYFVCPAVVAHTGKENIEYRISNNESGSGKREAGSWKSEDGRPKTEAGSQGQSGPAVCNRGLYFVCPAVAAHTGKENEEYRMMNIESKRNIPVRCTFGFNRISSATKVIGALHLRFPTSSTAISERAAAPRNLCSFGYHPSEIKVHRTEILNVVSSNPKGLDILPRGVKPGAGFDFNAVRNNERLIINNQYKIINIQKGWNNPAGDNTAGNDIPPPSPSGEVSLPPPLWGGREGLPPLWGGREGLPPRLPRGGFFGDSPGAAAITSNVLYSSPRASLTRSACKVLPVINRFSSFSPFRGGCREEAFIQKGGT